MNPSILRFVLTLVATWILAGWHPSRAEEAPVMMPPTLANLDFEDSAPGEIPSGWFVPSAVRAKGFAAFTVAERCASGDRCALVTPEKEVAGPPGFGNLMRSLDATPYRGQRIRLSAAVRVEVEGSHRAQLWLRVDREGGGRGFFDNMGDRPIVDAGWQRYEIVGEVADDAQTINFGLMLLDQGKAWLDSVRFEVLETTGNEPPRALTDHGLENLIALTRLLGYVRYFHPSDQAADVDWEQLALAGIQTVEGASSSVELASALDEVFRPVAPTIRVFSGDPPPPAAPPENAAELDMVAWRHVGVDISGPRSTYRSQRINDRQTPVADPGHLGQFVTVERHRGQRVRLRATARAETAVGGAHLWIQDMTVNGGQKPPHFGAEPRF